MNSVGVFHEKEIHGKPFLICNFLSQKDNPTSSSSTFSTETAIDSNGDDLAPLQPLFICQSFRKSIDWMNRRENDPTRQDFLPVDVYPHFFNLKGGDQQFKFLIGSDIYDHPCKFPLVPLFWCNNKEPNHPTFYCGVCKDIKLGTEYFSCVTCRSKFHKECIESPLEIKHPSYPFLSLKLYYPPNNYLRNLRCFCCQRDIHEMLYYSPTKKLFLHPVCAMKPIPIVIDHPKRHLHPLTFFPKQDSLACDICGLIKEHVPTYICARCVFVAHQDCVYSPNVIKISRHHHRISFTYSFPFGKWSCGVCRRKVDNNYGAYTCSSCDDYFVHTRCALREDLWDGEEIEGVLEELELVVEPFERIADGIILHFSHGHHLKLEISRIYEENKFCQACVLPIYEGSYYICMDQCDFILHETCANSPLKKHHALYAHPLTLKVVTNEYDDGKGKFVCYACGRESCGFVYEDPVGRWKLTLDVRCASVSEPFDYQGHEHPLFLALKPEEESLAICQICQEEGDGNNFCKKLNCLECNYVICFKCATLPYKARYKHDKHFLTFHEGNEASDDSDWCDACESKIVYSRKGGFYSCDNYCCTTLHVDCLLGEDPYLKPGHTISFFSDDVHIVRNKTFSRPFCHAHAEDRCPEKVVFIKKNMTFCSYSCSIQFR